MTGLDDLDDRLQSMAADVERTASPTPPSQVRRLGDRRRHRRHALTAVAAAVVVGLAGGVAVTQLSGLTDALPPPVANNQTAVPLPAPSTATPTARTLRGTNLLRAADVPSSGGPALEVAPAGTGRDLDQISVCVPDRLSVLGATSTATRDFRYPRQDRPAIQTVALQLADDAAAARAERTVTAWVDGCAATLEERGATLLGSGDPEWVDVATAPGTEGRFAVLPIYREPGQSGDEGVFESLGVTRVDDRLMLTVRVVVGMDDNVSLEAEPDPSDGMLAHPQFGLVTAAAERLAR